MSRAISYYIDLITSEYRQSTRFLAWLTAALTVLNDASSTIADIVAAFDLDNAVGVQLDIVGVLVGQRRKLNFEPTDGSGAVLSDANYRTLLKAKILKNHWKGQLGELVAAWQILFPGALIVVNDTQDMAIVVTLSGNFTPLLQELVTHGYIVPKPQGVRVNYSWGDLPVFGYDADNDYIGPYDKAKWAGYE